MTDTSALRAFANALRPALNAVVRVAETELRETTTAAYEVGYERGWLAGYTEAERDARPVGGSVVPTA